MDAKLLLLRGIWAKEVLFGHLPDVTPTSVFNILHGVSLSIILWLKAKEEVSIKDGYLDTFWTQALEAWNLELALIWFEEIIGFL